LFVILAIELVLVRPGISAETILRVTRIDGLYGLLAGLALVVGGLRVVYGVKGAAFYIHNPLFWTKLGLFLLVGLISISPTLNYIRWRKALRADSNALPNDASVKATRQLIHIELMLLFLMPILAAMMARGIGLS
jgi:putative membrane protein